MTSSAVVTARHTRQQPLALVAHRAGACTNRDRLYRDAVATLERDLISERVRAGLRHAVIVRGKRDDREHGLTNGRCGVDVLLVADELNGETAEDLQSSQ